MSKISIDHFSDILCIWAYVAQIRVDELQAQLGDRIAVAYRFIDVFGSTEQKIGKGWEKRGGFEGYADHVAEVAAGFPHVELSPEAWRGCLPRSSGTSHLFLKAAQLTSVRAEDLARRIRLAFFRDARDVGELAVLREIAAELDVDAEPIDRALADGTAMAALSEDAKLGDRFRVEGSPTYVLNEGRQKLYGNVGYKVIEANVLELIEVPEGEGQLVLRNLFAFSLLLLLVAAPGCEQAAPLHPGLVPGTHVFTTADGLEIPYDVHGDGETTVLLVHCWMCQRTFWEAQVPVLEPGYRVIALDLGGHGEAGATRETWTISGYGEDVAALIEHLGLERVVLVGHSMGGPVALEAAALSQGKVLGVVAVDTLHDADFNYDQPQLNHMVQAFLDDFTGTCNQFIGFMFPEEGVEQIQEHVRVVGCDESNHDVGQALMLDFGRLDLPAMYRNAGVPIRAINAAAPNPTQIETNRKYADFDAVLMEGVGHYPHMTRPDDFNPLLLQTIEELAP